MWRVEFEAQSVDCRVRSENVTNRLGSVICKVLECIEYRM